MISPGIRTTMMLLSVAILLPQPACKTQEDPSALIGRYTFSRDFDDERRVLRVEPSSEYVAECMQAALPVGDGAAWKEVNLDDELHHELIALLLDESRSPHYEADTEASNVAAIVVCMKQVGGDEFCYEPQVSVTGVARPWRFRLQAEIELSSESQELIDAFLSVHDACWNAGTRMNGGG